MAMSHGIVVKDQFVACKHPLLSHTDRLFALFNLHTAETMSFGVETC